MSRRGSMIPASRKSVDMKGKRVSLKDNNLGVPTLHRASEIKDGDIYYKTTHIYPSLPDYPEEITVTVVKSGKEQRSESRNDSRRGSVLSERGSRDDASSPHAGRDSPAHDRDRAASIAASAGGPDSKRPKLAIWPEWNDADVNAEKWDAVHKGKEKVDKGKSPVAVQAYDDIEGKIDMPPSLRVVQWKRPSDFITEKTPVVVDPDHGMNGFDLINCNEHLHDSELMRFIISQITALWEMSAIKNPPPDQADASVPYEEYTYSWRPWEHIYTINKVQKGPHIPPYNPYGKYAVRLYWMGCWRKIIVDDQMPFDDNDQLLLPATSHQHELWPMLLTKGLIKIASLEYSGGSASSEFGDCNIIQCLTGWIPESIPLQYGHINEVWELLKSSLPEWKLPLQEWEKQQDQLEEKKDEGTPSEIAKEDKSEKDSAKDAKGEKADVKSGKDTGKDKAAKDGKDKDKGGKDKDKKDKGDKDKDKKDKEKSTLDETPLPENPEVVVFATYCSTPKYPVKVSVLGEMADASERLRQNGLSHIYPHPVWITQTRSCPLEPPPPPEIVPAWKLIRPKKKKTLPTDEPMAEAEPPKPIQCIEITSPFVNYKVSPVPIPTETHRPRSSLERGGTRSRPATGNVGSIEETDENAPEPEPVPQKVEPVEPPPDETQVEEPPIEAVSPAPKPSTPGEKKKKGSGKSREGKESKDTKDNREASPKTTQRKMSTSDKSKTERGKSAEKVASASKTKEEEKEKAKVPPPPSTPTQQLDSGLAPPPPPEGQTPEDGEEAEIEGEIAIEEPVEQDDSAKPKKVWMDFMEFCKCFKTLYIYHKPNTYPCNHKYSDPKKMERLYNTQLITQSAVPAGKADKKSAPATAGPTGYDDRSPHYLFVDNLKPTEIVVCFVSLSRWHEPPPITIDEKKSHTSIKGKGDKNEPEKELTNVTSSSVLDGSIGGEKPTPVVVQPGTLVAEPYSWKSLVTGQPILRLRTTATKAAVLSLPAGRHVLRFMMSGPLGHHVHLCSSVQFVFGDEETVMQHLTKESCRFVDNATQVMNSIGKCINAFNDTEGFKQAWDELVSYHCPYRNDKLMSKQHHFQVFNEALYNTLTKSLKDIINLETVYAWRVFNYDTTTKNILGLSSGSRPATGTTSQRGSAKQPPAKGDKDKDKNKQAPVEGEAEKVENPWANREPTNEELVSAVKLQKSWRGYWVRKIKAARTPGTEENLKVMEILQKCWTILEANAESNGLFLFRYMFRLDPELMQKYPFYQDEWNKISYNDYSGQYPDQPPNNWFIVFREVFHVIEETLAVPKLYVPINTCMLRVVNNDTGEEIPRVFQKVAPHVYKKNKKGYTFVAEARTLDQGIPSGKWRMRLIGSLSPLPAPLPPRNEVNSAFHAREIRDYYIPNDNQVILRYAVKVNEDHLTSIQINTSKLDVHVKLTVLDNEVEMASTVGKGHAVIPSYTFLKDIDPNEQRSSSRASNKDTKGKAGSQQNVGKKRISSGKSADGRGSRASHHSDALEDEIDEKDLKPHKYIIQATVLKNSWPLSESSWTFVQMLKEIEKNDLKVINKDRPPSPPKQEKAPAASSTTGKGGKGGKGGKDKGGKDKDKNDKGSRPPSQQFDITKPHWTLRIVSDASNAEDVEVKKDTERVDEIRALKKAWEAAEPGRAAKALQARLEYLNKNIIKLQPDEEEPKEGEEKPSEETENLPPQTPISMHEQADEILTLEPPPPPTPKEFLQPLDLTPFIRRGAGEPRYLDDYEIQRRQEEQKRQVEEYKAFRDQVKQWREHDKQMRNMIKQKQLEQCEELQTMLDNARDSINKPREAFRQKYLEAERKRLEEMAEKEASLKDQEAKSPKGRKSAKGKKSPAGGK